MQQHCWFFVCVSPFPSSFVLYGNCLCPPGLFPSSSLFGGPATVGMADSQRVPQQGVQSIAPLLATVCYPTLRLYGNSWFPSSLQFVWHRVS